VTHAELVPRVRTSPEVRERNPSTTFTVVDLPVPFGPSRATVSPWAMVRERSDAAVWPLPHNSGAGGDGALRPEDVAK
jgi:hypothetical protein